MSVSLSMDTSFICDKSAPSNYECLYCAVDIEDGCECVLDDTTEFVDVYCYGCEEVHEDISTYQLLGIDTSDWDTGEMEIIEIDSDDEQSIEERMALMGLFKNNSTTTEADYVPRFSYSSKCRHYNVPFTTLEGVTVYASSQHTREPWEEAPDFGLYLDSSWHASCLAYTIDWPDYGIPRRFDIAAKAIIDTYNKAREGLWVEIGCIGGHGRTGTALACMAVLGGMKPDDAIHHVRSTYCDHTIETDEQAWFVEWFNIFVNTGELDYIRYDKKKKKDVVVKHFTFTTPFDWEVYDPEAFPVGAPSEEIQNTVWDTYVIVPVWHKKKKKWVYEYINEGEDGFPEAYAAYRAQKAADRKAATLKQEADEVESQLASSIAASAADNPDEEPF